jgi:nitroreductase
MVGSLTVDEVLTTTRSVRKRLDFTRPVERQVLEECLAAAQQAPSGGNLQTWGFVVITDRDRRAALADLYRRGHRLWQPRLGRSTVEVVKALRPQQP